MPDIQECFYTSTDGRELFYRQLDPADEPKALLLLVHGYAEHSGRYAHVMEHYAALGFRVFAPDHRGHGRSAIILGDLESIDQVVDDLVTLKERLLATAPASTPLFIHGHSMGGMLSTLLLQRSPNHVTGAVLNGAALEIPDDIPQVVLSAAKVLAKLTPTLGVQDFYSPEELTKVDAVNDATRTDPLFYRGKIRARTGDELLKGVHAARAGLAEIHVPLLITHGAEDSTVPVEASHILHRGVASTDKELHLFDGLKHEVHNEANRDQVLKRYSDWFQERL